MQERYQLVCLESFTDPACWAVVCSDWMFHVSELILLDIPNLICVTPQREWHSQDRTNIFLRDQTFSHDNYLLSSMYYSTWPVLLCRTCPWYINKNSSWWNEMKVTISNDVGLDCRTSRMHRMNKLPAVLLNAGWWFHFLIKGSQ